MLSMGGRSITAIALPCTWPRPHTYAMYEVCPCVTRWLPQKNRVTCSQGQVPEMTKLKKKRRTRKKLGGIRKKKLQNPTLLAHFMHEFAGHALASTMAAVGCSHAPHTPSRKNRRRVNEILKITAIACAPVFDQWTMRVSSALISHGETT
jgi:hypothetical protein